MAAVQSHDAVVHVAERVEAELRAVGAAHRYRAEAEGEEEEGNRLSGRGTIEQLMELPLLFLSTLL